MKSSRSHHADYEFFGIMTKPLALTIRLFAQYFAGIHYHSALTSLVFLTVARACGQSSNEVPPRSVFCGSMMGLETVGRIHTGVCFSTMLSSIFIGLSRQEPHKHKTACAVQDQSIH